MADITDGPGPDEEHSGHLLERVIHQYLTSSDFNGLYLSGADRADAKAAASLVQDGLVQVVSEDDFPNPHIRPWPAKRSVEQQVGSLEDLATAQYGVCLYPTPTALSEVHLPAEFDEQPYRRTMARGRGSLELAYFSFDVLEQYRNDPRFTFEFYDFGARTVIGDEAYEDQAEPDHDKIVMDHIGFAYDLSNYDRDDPESPIVRRVCAFYGDLADLSPRHQQRWKTYEVDADSKLEPHPVWWAQQGGHWPDGLGPFEALFLELKALNDLNEKAFGVPLLSTTSRPRDLGWVLRPSQQEWDTFIALLDKLLSENLRHQALDEMNAPRTDSDGQRLGTIRRLEQALVAQKIDQEAVADLLRPIREIRAARQKPAHTLRTNLTDKTFVHRQVELLNQVTVRIEALRRFWQRHSANSDWQEHEYLREGARRYRF